jgi:hypothetical protein
MCVESELPKHPLRNSKMAKKQVRRIGEEILGGFARSRKERWVAL